MRQFKGLTKGQSWLLVVLSGISIFAIFFIACAFVKTAYADSETIVYLADRDQDYDRVVGSGVVIGSSAYFHRGVCISTETGQNLGSVVVIVTVDPNATTLEVSVESRGEGKMFVIKNDITQQAGKPLGDTFDLLCDKPKIFYLYPASEYIDDEGNIEIHIGTQEGQKFDVNYVRVRSLDYKPLSTYREPRIVYDYPPTYSVAQPSIWFAIYRGPYVYWDSSIGCYVAYDGWWARPSYLLWYYPYYERVIVPIYHEHHYYFYHEVPRYERGRVREHYAGTHWRGDRGRGGGRHLGVQNVGNDGDRGSAYAAPAKKNRSAIGDRTDVRRGVSSDRVREETPRLSDNAIKSEGKKLPNRTKEILSQRGDGGAERSLSLTDLSIKDSTKPVGIKTKRNEIREVKDTSTRDNGNLWQSVSHSQRAPRVIEKQKSLSILEQESHIQRQSERTAVISTDVAGDFVRTLRGNSTAKAKVRREVSPVRPEASRSVQSVQPVQWEALNSVREVIKRRFEAQPRQDPQPQQRVQPAQSSPAPAQTDDDDQNKKHRR